MRVTLVGRTEFVPPKHIPCEFEGTTGEDLSVMAGRLCYLSWHKPNKATATNAGYLANILKQQHFSVLEHGSVSFLIEGVSRALTHEICRHRMFSYSQVSQRFVASEDATLVLPPVVPEDSKSARAIESAFTVARSAYRYLLESLKEQDDELARKQIREAARSVLPNCTETAIVVTGNHRAWLDMLAKRWSVHADAEICLLAGEILSQLREEAPNIYTNIPEVPYGTDES